MTEGKREAQIRKNKTRTTYIIIITTSANTSPCRYTTTIHHYNSCFYSITAATTTSAGAVAKLLLCLSWSDHYVRTHIPTTSIADASSSSEPPTRWQLLSHLRKEAPSQPRGIHNTPLLKEPGLLLRRGRKSDAAGRHIPVTSLPPPRPITPPAASLFQNPCWRQTPSLFQAVVLH